MGFYVSKRIIGRGLFAVLQDTIEKIDSLSYHKGKMDSIYLIDFILNKNNVLPKTRHKGGLHA